MTLPRCLALILAILAAVQVPAHAAETVWLTSLDLSAVDQGYGTPHVDQSVDGHPITIAGQRFEHGLGTHSPGAFIIDLNGGTSRFVASVGIDSEVGNRGSAEFSVLGDGKTLWTSGLMRGGQPAKLVNVDTSGVRQLALLVGDAGDGYEFDHADWADARFEVTGARPVSFKGEATQPKIAGPETSLAPRIHSPAIVGVLPNTPFLYTIAATGKAPITFSARGLPRGLKLDRITGQITGRLARPGQHTVTMRATNSAGSDSRSLRIVVGSAIALTPPMGWNSYDSFGDDVTEAEILANARSMKEHLASHGWQYVVVDYRWYDPGASSAPNNPNARTGALLAMDEFGRLQPAPNRFPSSAGGIGFKALADQIHSIGLKFGIHIMRGIPRLAVNKNLPIAGSPFHAADAANKTDNCGWCPDMYGVDPAKPAGQAWYDSIFRQYADWGVDLVKMDDTSAPYHAGEIEDVRRAINRCGRSIVYSLSPGETPLDDAAHVGAHANMWRISGDFWDDWGALAHQFDLLTRWVGHGGPGHWPDADMIPLGHLSIGSRSVGPDRRTHFTRDEQITLISLWCLAPSPLMLGMNLPDNDPWTESLLTNDEVIAVDQDPAGRQARLITPPAGLLGIQVWVREMADGTRVVGLFNRLRLPLPASVQWTDLGITGPQTVRDLWQRKDLGVFPQGFQTRIDPHGAVLIRLQPARR